MEKLPYFGDTLKDPYEYNEAYLHSIYDLGD